MNVTGFAAVLRGRAFSLRYVKTRVERVCTALLSMSADMLRDIGVDRGEIVPGLARLRSSRGSGG
jgi:uncharacterized protein YjiS (DUF1127 family)